MLSLSNLKHRRCPSEWYRSSGRSRKLESTYKPVQEKEPYGDAVNPGSAAAAHQLLHPGPDHLDPAVAATWTRWVGGELRAAGAEFRAYGAHGLMGFRSQKALVGICQT